jgi:hypothetical protein
MAVEAYMNLFWKNWQGKKPDKPLQSLINTSLRETYYSLGIKKVKALEGIKGIVTKNKVYPVHLVKDKFFPEGEECILGNNKEYVTLDCFKREVIWNYYCFCWNSISR